MRATLAFNGLISKFMTSQAGKQTIAMQILSYISQSQLIEHNTRNIFLEKSYTKCDGQTIPRPFSKKSKLNISLDLKSKV